MQTINRATLELILKSFEASSKDETRQQLNTVRIGKDGDSLIIESTDGHILCRHFIQDDFDIDGDILIHRDSKKKIKSFLADNKHVMKYTIDTDIETNRNLRIFTSDNRDGMMLPVVFRDYPNTNAVIPKFNIDQEYNEVIFNPELLMKLYKSMNGAKRGIKVKLLIKKDNPLSPIMVESGNQNLGVIMPIRA